MERGAGQPESRPDSDPARRDGRDESARPAIPTEAELASYRRGSNTALDALFARYAPIVRARVARSVRPRQAEDVTQEVLLRAFRSVGRFEYRGPGSFRAWLATIANHCIIDRRRRARAERRSESRSLEDADGSGALADARTPTRAAIAREGLEAYEARLARLPLRDRRLIELRDSDRLRFEQIAERLGMPTANAARFAYGRARDQLGPRRGRAG